MTNKLPQSAAEASSLARIVEITTEAEALEEAPTRTFSDFIRNALPEEKAMVYDDVMKRASERQRASQPGTRAEE